VRQQQNVQEKAAAQVCPGAQACPYSKDPTHLFNCTPPESDNSPDDQVCNTAGRIGSCGGQQFCCPAAGSVWTTNMTACAVATPTPTPTPTPSPTPTAAPNTCNGTCGSDSNCQTGLICSSGFCRNPLCVSSSDCACGAATPTPTATSSATPVPTQVVQGTPRAIPVTGTDWPTVTGIGVGAAAIIVSILIAL